MEKINNITPGEILLEEFLKPLEISAYRLSKDTGMPATRISQILLKEKKDNCRYCLKAVKIFWQFSN